MSQFSYSFCITIFHSIWQAALILLLYVIVSPVLKNQLPGARRNTLYVLLIFQLIISVLTFLFSYFGSPEMYLSLLTASTSNILVQQYLLQRYSSLLMTFYVVAVLFQTITKARSWILFKNTHAHSLLKPTIHFKAFTLLKVHQFGIKRSVTLWFSNAAQSPLTYGFFKPVIILPIALINHLSIHETESLIIHELTHIRNNDYFLNWLLVIIQTIYFFNPFIKLLCNKVKLEREKDCDLRVLQFKYPAVGYAETLLKAARFRKTNMNYNFTLAAVFGNKQLLKRIHFFTREKEFVQKRSKNNFATLLVILLVLFSNLVLLSTNREKISKAADNGADIVSVFNKDIKKRHTTEINTSAFGESYDPNIIPEKAVTLPNKPIIVDLKKEATITEPLDLLEEEGNFSENAILDYSLPVVDKSANVKEVIIEEENSVTGQIITKAFTVEWKDGQWKDELLYIKKQGKPLLDSIGRFIDSTQRLFIPSMQ